MAGECTAGAFLLSPRAAAQYQGAAARPNPPALGAFAEGHPGHPLQRRTPLFGSSPEEKMVRGKERPAFSSVKTEKIRVLRYGFFERRQILSPKGG